MKKGYDLPCNIAQSLNLIGDRWTLLIIHDILTGKTTFNELKQSLSGISSNILSERLKQLEEEGLVVSRLYSSHPPRYEYQLTERSRELDDVFKALIIWGSKHLDKCYKKATHSECGHEVDVAYYCPHCKANVTDVSIVPAE